MTKARNRTPVTPGNVEAMKRVAERVFGDGVGVVILIVGRTSEGPGVTLAGNMSDGETRRVLSHIVARFDEGRDVPTSNERGSYETH